MLKPKILGAGVVAAAFVLVANGCYTQQQPPSECNIISSQEWAGITPFFGELTKQGSTGTCTDVPSNDLSYLLIGTTRFGARGSTFDTWRFYFRLSYLVDVADGHVYSANTDTTNDCSATTSPGKCVACVTGTSPNLLLPDGGAAVDSVTAADGGLLGVPYSTLSDGGVTRVNLANRCGTTLEGVTRSDPSDPDGVNIDLVGKVGGRTPDSSGICQIQDITGGVQNLAAVAGFPAITLKAEATNIELVNTTKAPGTFFTSNLKLTEGSCVTDYALKAFWPIHECDTDADCNPTADADAGQVFGSGLSPSFLPKCNTAYQLSGDYAGVCTPTVGADALKN